MPQVIVDMDEYGLLRLYKSRWEHLVGQMGQDGTRHLQIALVLALNDYPSPQIAADPDPLDVGAVAYSKQLSPSPS